MKALFYRGFVLAIVVFALELTVCAAESKQQTRSFHMGFTAFPPDVTPDAVQHTREFVRTNADLIAHHIEGVPWAEALRN